MLCFKVTRYTVITQLFRLVSYDYDIYLWEMLMSDIPKMRVKYSVTQREKRERTLGREREGEREEDKTAER